MKFNEIDIIFYYYYYYYYYYYVLLLFFIIVAMYGYDAAAATCKIYVECNGRNGKFSL